MKRILITGANSYIGISVENWLNKTHGKYIVDTLDMIGDAWRDYDFSSYDVVYHVAGIAHADVGNVTEEQKKLYYQVNTDLAVETAEKAKASGVKQFIFMSSMIVYSGCKEKIITANTQPNPLNFYGDSKWQADQKIRALADDNFKVVVLRPPMIYGKGSKGNYPELAKLASKLPVFPIVKNKRSMLYIENLCQFVKLMIDNEESGVFFPQNAEYTNTSDMVQMIAEVKGHRIVMVPFTNTAVKLMGKVPGKIGGLANKAFGDSAYEMGMSAYKEDYRVVSLRKSIELTEGTD
ncbi:MAG: sugar nucleotide-binding protein [Bacteroides thetaiotaomicron]|nr:sugar nucleotide-binding protein [Bacteroides thetaiotaomicron]